MEHEPWQIRKSLKSKSVCTAETPAGRRDWRDWWLLQEKEWVGGTIFEEKMKTCQTQMSHRKLYVDGIGLGSDGFGWGEV